MLPKSSVLLLLFSYSTIPIIFTTSIPSDLTRAPADDADAAFQDLIATSTDILNTKYNETNALLAEAHQQLDEMQHEALDTLARKLTEIKSKIAEIQANLVTLSINDSCNYYPEAQMDDFQANATARILQCTELSKGVISNIFAETWDDFSTQQSGYMGCVARSLGHCHGFAIDDRCFEHIVSFIATRKVNLQDAFERIDFNFRNKLISVKMPCQKMIDFELSTYPDYFVPYMSQCAENVIKMGRPWTCANGIL